MGQVEEQVGRRYGSDTDPLLVAVRSGAKFSMPGMMDTVLNVGMNDDVAAAMIARTGDERFVLDSYRRLVQMFATVVLGLDDEPFERILRDQRAEHRTDNDAALPAGALRDVVDRFRSEVDSRLRHAVPDRSRWSSSGSRSRPCSHRGTASEPSTTATPPASPTTSAPPWSSSRWCSATPATSRAPAC